MSVNTLVDHNYLLRDICVGWPGSTNDTVLANFQLEDY